jgi:hypothetical protein
MADEQEPKGEPELGRLPKTFLPPGCFAASQPEYARIPIDANAHAHGPGAVDPATVYRTLRQLENGDLSHPPGIHKSREQRDECIRLRRRERTTSRPGRGSWSNIRPCWVAFRSIHAKAAELRVAGHGTMRIGPTPAMSPTEVDRPTGVPISIKVRVSRLIGSITRTRDYVR